MPSTSRQIDLRVLAPRESAALIFATWRGLDRAESMELLSDHDTRLLQRQLQSELPGGFDWAELEAGPAIWRVRVTRVDAATPGGCCGGCSGA